jgi:[protein-PII] uridylyltransferase
VTLDRGPLLADRTLTGAAWCAQHTLLLDEWLAALYDAASPPDSGVALVAVGGYGRSELCPASDVDLMLVHHKRANVRELADRLWYPIWDSGLKLGHSVCTVQQALRLASDDLDTATALLSARRIGGDELLVDELANKGREQWENGARRWLEQLARRVDERHASAGEVAFLLEPDLKEGRGGMRDVHALKWAEAARHVLFTTDEPQLDKAYAVLLDARVELQRATGRSLNILTLQDRAAVADALGDPSPEVLLGRISEAARAIAWMSDDTWRRVRSGLKGPSGRGAGRVRPVGEGVAERDGEIFVEEEAWDGHDPLLVLRVAAASAGRDLPIERATLDHLSDVPIALPEPWPAEARELLQRLLLAGPSTIGVVEALDHHGLWEQLVPEWRSVRSRPQHNPYHRFTVDRHLLETIANASELTSTVDRPDLLALAALLHDLGKIGEGDHTTVGIELAAVVCARIGCSSEETDILQGLVRNHLLLSDVASRRDLDDEATIEFVARAVGSVGSLHLLAALTEADAKATGPSAWSPWKAELVGVLVVRVDAYLRGEPKPLVSKPSLRDVDELETTEPGHNRIVAEDGVVTIVTDDRPGVFSRVAGVLALRGLDVLEAVAHSTADGRALSRFRVVDQRRAETPWADITADVDRALLGRLAIQARLADRARSHARQRRLTTSARTAVTFDNAASDEATVIDVEAPDAVGLLYRITQALSDLDLDIRSAKVQTLGAQVVDAFYVRDRSGAKVDDSGLMAEIERALLYAVRQE